jgi:hypothetical protein
MQKFKVMVLAGMLVIGANVFAEPEFPKVRVDYDEHTVNLMNAVKRAVDECPSQLKSTHETSDAITRMEVEYIPSSTPGAPDDQLYTISTARGDFWGPTLSIHRHFDVQDPSTPEKGVWLTTCSVAY